MKTLSSVVIAFVWLVAPLFCFGQALPTTTNIGLQLPPYNFGAWNVPLNYNSVLLDQLLSGVTPLPALSVSGQLTAPQLTTWAILATYPANKIVFYLGQEYYSLAAGNTGNLPTNASFWGVGSGTGGGGGSGCSGTCLLAANNLSDLANAATARTNLGLGSAATQPSSAFDAVGTATTAAAAAAAAATAAAVASGPAGSFASYPALGAGVGPSTHLSDSGTAITSLVPVVVNDSADVSTITLGVGGLVGPELTAAAGAPTGCGSTYPVGSFDANSTGGPGSAGYNCSAAALPQTLGALNQGQVAKGNVAGGSIVTGADFGTLFTLGVPSTISQCSFYAGHFTNNSFHIGCGILTAPTNSTSGTSVLCYNTYNETGGPINSTVSLPLTGCGTLAAGSYWVFSFTDDSGYVSIGTTNCGGTCAHPSYEGTLTYTFGGAPVITTSAMSLSLAGLDFVQSVVATPTGTPWIPSAPVGADINAAGQVQGIAGVPLPSLGAGPLGLDQNGAPRIMPLGDTAISATGVFGNSTDFPSGRQIAVFIPQNAGIITGINVVMASIAGGSCGGAPTFNVFVGGTGNTGTAVLASATAQTTVGSITSQGQALPFGAGYVIGVYVSTQGTTCLAPIYNVTMSFTEQ